MVGSSFLIDALDRDASADEILRLFNEKVERFQATRAKYLLY
jgi:uncharacterized protein YbbC (DUF1343 family)